MPTRRTRSTVERTIAARQQLAARDASYSRVSVARRTASLVAVTGDEDVEGLMAKLGREHDRAEQRLGAALAEQRHSSDRYDAAAGRFARLDAAIDLHAADQEVAARDAWLRWVGDDGYRGLNAGPFELRAGESGK
jgi:hypothetical protein